MSEVSTPSPAAPEEDEIVDAPRRKRPKEDDEMDITPMIDITFLLLIFFLVASKIDDSASVAIPVTEFGDSAAPQDAVIITIAESGEEMADVFLGEGTGAAIQAGGADRDSQREEIVDYIVADVAGSPNKYMVMIMAEKRVTQGEVDRVAQAVTEANGQLTSEGVGEIKQILLAVKQEG